MIVISLPERHRRRVEEILREKVPYAEVWVYGSRIDGTSHEGSDLDLVLRAPGLRPIPSDELQAARAVQRLEHTRHIRSVPFSLVKEFERNTRTVRNYIPAKKATQAIASRRITDKPIHLYLKDRIPITRQGTDLSRMDGMRSDWLSVP